MKGKIKATLRRFLSIALAALILAGCAGAAFADGSNASGTLNGVNWVYTAADKTLVLSGSGTLGDGERESNLFGASWSANHVKIGPTSTSNRDGYLTTSTLLRRMKSTRTTNISATPTAYS